MKQYQWCVSALWMVLTCLGGACSEDLSNPTDSGAMRPPDGAVPSPVVDASTPPAPFAPSGYCPGSEGCEDVGDDQLYAGAAARAITPSLSDNEALLVDVDSDGEYDPSDGDTFDDRNGNGIWDRVWIAGFGLGRDAQGIHDEQWTRAVALRQNETLIVMVSLDVVGFFLDDMDVIRMALSDLDIDHLAIASTHGHQGRDTIGIWGPRFDISGRDPDYIAYIQSQTAEAVRAAVGALVPSQIQYASFRLRDQPGGTERYVSDIRDPQIIDDEVRLIRLQTKESATAPAEPTTIATLVNFGAHPEYLGPSNNQLSSDFPHWLRTGIEEGTATPEGAPEPGIGGVTLFFNGAVGSQIGPGDVRLMRWSGEAVETGTVDAGETLGSQLAYFCLRALNETSGAITDETADLGFRHVRFEVAIENQGYQIALQQNVLERRTYSWDDSRPIRNGMNTPHVLTEATVIDVGRASLIGVPGELDPALFVGGYDGAYTPEGREVINRGLDNPPDLDEAPSGPYLRQQTRDDAEQIWLLGMTNDYLGYFIPSFDYELHPTLPYILEAEGDHYEETTSAGINAWPTIETQLEALLRWRPGD